MAEQQMVLFRLGADEYGIPISQEDKGDGSFCLKIEVL